MQIKYLPSAIYKINRLASNPDANDAIASQRLIIINKFDNLKRNTTLCDKEICKVLDVCRATIYGWKQRYKAKGLKGLSNKSRAPHKRRSTMQTTKTKNLILKLRKENPTYGKEKIHAILKRDHKINISQSTVGRVLTKFIALNLIQKVFYLFKPKNPRVFNKHAKRFQYGMKASKPGELVQIDHMTVNNKLNFTIKHFAAIDPTTKLLEARGYYGAKSKTAAQFLDHVIKSFPFEIKSIQVDGGSEFMKEFETACFDKGIQLYVLPPRKPKWNGCVERSNRTLREEFYAIYDKPHDMHHLREMLDDYLIKYNTYRPHHSLNLLTPICYYVDNFKEAS